MLTITNLSKSYGSKSIFQHINLTLTPGKPIVIMGHNGCGKSTLLKIIAGVIPPTAGEIRFAPNIKIAYIPDRFPKLPFTVEEYLMHMGKIQGQSPQQITQYIQAYFPMLNMPADFKNTKISKCSKGTIQKVNILQALITQPQLLILDEPFEGLDENSEANFIQLIQQLTAQGVAIILACHERKLAEKITTEIYTFANKTCTLHRPTATMYAIQYLAGAHICTQCVEKPQLSQALTQLIAQGHAIESVNPTGGTHE